MLCSVNTINLIHYSGLPLKCCWITNIIPNNLNKVYCIVKDSIICTYYTINKTAKPLAFKKKSILHKDSEDIAC